MAARPENRPNRRTAGKPLRHRQTRLCRRSELRHQYLTQQLRQRHAGRFRRNAPEHTLGLSEPHPICQPKPQQRKQRPRQHRPPGYLLAHRLARTRHIADRRRHPDRTNRLMGRHTHRRYQNLPHLQHPPMETNRPTTFLPRQKHPARHGRSLY